MRDNTCDADTAAASIVHCCIVRRWSHLLSVVVVVVVVVLYPYPLWELGA